MKLPEHMFVSSTTGDLHDTRQKDWAANPLRKKYQWTSQWIKTASQFKATLRAGPYAWPGGYPMYFITQDCAALCFACARKEARQIFWDFHNDCSTGWRVAAVEVNYEDDQLCCDHCSKEIPSAYGKEEILAQRQAEGRD